MAAIRPFAVGPRNQTLRNDVTKRLRDPGADHALFIFGKHADDAVDGLGRVDGMQSGQHEVAGFGSLERDFDRFPVAHLADQNHFGRLPQSGAQSNRKTRRIGMKFALMNGASSYACEETRSDLRW